MSSTTLHRQTSDMTLLWQEIKYAILPLLCMSIPVCAIKALLILGEIMIMEIFIPKTKAWWIITVYIIMLQLCKFLWNFYFSNELYTLIPSLLCILGCLKGML